MIKRLTAFSLALLLPTAGYPCLFSNATQLPLNTTFALGPTLYSAVTANPSIGTAILAGRDAWNVSHAINRIGGWSSTTSGSDCPAGQSFQVGAFGFNGSTCQTAVAYGVTNPPAGSIVLAFVDYFPGTCPQCGTKSLSFNLNVAWSLTPTAGQYDIQSVAAHEFGHVLGVAHTEGNGTLCDPFAPNTRSPACSESPGRETMGRNTYPAFSIYGSTLMTDAETCQRDLSPWDINSVNLLY